MSQALVLRLRGGMGNQLFQLALAGHLRESGREVQLDLSELRQPFFSDRLPWAELASALGIGVSQGRHICRGAPLAEPGDLSLHEVNDWLNDDPSICCFSGYFQFPELLTLPSTISAIGAVLGSLSRAHAGDGYAPKTCIHVRVGDYARPSAAAAYGCLSSEYYIACLREMSAGPRIDLVTDDRKGFARLHKSLMAEFDVTETPHTREFRAMQALSASSKLAISNSTFAIWAAWLGSVVLGTTKEVLFPLPWHIDGTQMKLSSLGWTAIDSAFLDPKDIDVPFKRIRTHRLRFLHR